MSHNPQVFHAPSNRLSAQAREMFGKFKPRVLLAGEAPPAQDNVWDRPVYVPPRGVNLREGSQVGLLIKSRGLST